MLRRHHGSCMWMVVSNLHMSSLHSPSHALSDANLQLPVQLSNVRSVYQCFCALNEAIHRSLYALSAPDTSLTLAKVLQIYRRHLHWYDQLPGNMRLGHNSTPAVLFMQ